MKKLIVIVCIMLSAIVGAQPPQVTLSPSGFDPVDVSVPAMPNERFIDLSKNWALESYKRGGYDITEVTANSLTISATERNAFFYRNKGEGFDHDVRYDMKITFYGNRYTAQFIVKQIFADNIQIKSTLGDFFDSNGNPKEGFNDVKPSMEFTVNKVLRSYYNFVTNFR